MTVKVAHTVAEVPVEQVSATLAVAVTAVVPAVPAAEVAECTEKMSHWYG